MSSVGILSLRCQGDTQLPVISLTCGCRVQGSVLGLVFAIVGVLEPLEIGSSTKHAVDNIIQKQIPETDIVSNSQTENWVKAPSFVKKGKHQWEVRLPCANASGKCICHIICPYL